VHEGTQQQARLDGEAEPGLQAGRAGDEVRQPPGRAVLPRGDARGGAQRSLTLRPLYSRYSGVPAESVTTCAWWLRV